MLVDLYGMKQITHIETDDSVIGIIGITGIGTYCEETYGHCPLKLIRSHPRHSPWLVMHTCSCVPFHCLDSSKASSFLPGKSAMGWSQGLSSENDRLLVELRKLAVEGFDLLGLLVRNGEAS